MEYEILADVSIDIDNEFLKNNKIEFVPMEYVVGDKTYRCTAPESDEAMHEFYDKLRNKATTQTSQITPYHYVEVFRPYAEAHRPVIYLSLSSGLSTTYESAQMAVKMLAEDYEDVQIEVVDSLGATGGMGLLAESACENRRKGMPLKENADWLRVHAAKQNLWFEVEDLMYLMRGGRVSAATAVLGTALGIRPILNVNSEGKLDTVTKKRGSRQAMRCLLERMEENFDPSVSNSVYICCADCKKDAEQLKADVLKKFPQVDVHITMLSPIIGAHTGPDMVALIFYGKGR